jgi:hypothetical protein
MTLTSRAASAGQSRWDRLCRSGYRAPVSSTMHHSPKSPVRRGELSRARKRPAGGRSLKSRSVVQ